MATITAFTLTQNSTTVHVNVSLCSITSDTYPLQVSFSFTPVAFNCFCLFEIFEGKTYATVTNEELRELATKFFSAEKFAELKNQVSVETLRMDEEKIELEKQSSINLIALQQEDRRMVQKGYKFRVPVVVHARGDDVFLHVYTESPKRDGVNSVVRHGAKKRGIQVEMLDIGKFVSIA